MSDPSRDVHTGHCCSVHGCKYRDADCTVTTGRHQQEYPCETCDWEWQDEGLKRELVALRAVNLLWELGSFAGSFAEFDPAIKDAQEALVRLQDLEARYERTHGRWLRNKEDPHG